MCSSRSVKFPVTPRGWRMSSNCASLAVSRQGGLLGPVVFQIRGRRVKPLATTSWPPAAVPPGQPHVLRYLRGDFFCAPFGANAAPYQGEKHPMHGESLELGWSLVRRNQDARGASLVARVRTKIRGGTITKHLWLPRDETAVYSRHILTGYAGPMPVGHHAMIAFEPGEVGRLGCSAFRIGQVRPEPFESPSHGGYSSLKTGTHFRSLRSVRLANGGFTDLTHYPARAGFDDLALVASKPAPIAWTAITLPHRRCLWFGLKDPAVLASTVFWFSNGGRHYPPWSGMHRRVLGIEEVTACFDLGLAESAHANVLTRRGVPTAMHLKADRPTVVNYLFAVTPLPRGFDRPVTASFEHPHQVAFFDQNGHKAMAKVNLNFFRGAEPFSHHARQ